MVGGYGAWFYLIDGVIWWLFFGWDVLLGLMGGRWCMVG